nr:CTP synthase [Bacillota bacterium]
ELNITANKPDMTEWNEMLKKIESRDKVVKIGLVGKYVSLHDAYLSVAEALRHAGYDYGTKIDIKWIDSETVTDENAKEILGECNGILIPGGFGNRGIEGKISACKFARENNIPYLGICLGMQIAVIEFARNVCGILDASSGEFEQTENKVIDFMEDQYEGRQKGGTLRLGAYPCKIKKGTMMEKCYKTDIISERHRHRYEFNNKYANLFVSKGLLISGTSPDEKIVETVEIPQNSFFVGVQFHPEFKSRPNKPHPLFKGFVKAALRRK